VKSVGGIGLLFAALYYMQPFFPQVLKNIPSPATSFLFATIAVAIVGLAIGAVNLSFHGGWPERIRKGVGVGLVVFGALGIWMWNQTPKQRLPYEHDEAAAFAKARAEHKGVMVDFAAEWCNPCKKMEKTFGNDDVYTAITANFVPLKFDVTADNGANEALKERYGAMTLPAVVFLDPDGTVLRRIHKETEADEMLDIVKLAASHDTLASTTPCRQ
jgi:thioredoxin:protein disulfide reductase